MTTYDLITKWMREANEEFEKAKKKENFQKMIKLRRIIMGLAKLRDDS